MGFNTSNFGDEKTFSSFHRRCASKYAPIPPPSPGNFRRRSGPSRRDGERRIQIDAAEHTEPAEWTLGGQRAFAAPPNSSLTFTVYVLACLVEESIAQ